MSAKRANLRAEMPAVTAWIDSLRAEFGAEAINGIIRGGMAGLPGFYAAENGHEVGTRPTAPLAQISAAQMVIGPLARSTTEGKGRAR